MSAPVDLKARAIEFLDIWCNEKDLSKGIAFLDPSMTAQHDDGPSVKGAEQFMVGWIKAMQFMPDFKIEVMNAIQEDNKV
jgi:hypothetical protein